MESLRQWLEWIVLAVDIAGVCVVVLGILYATLRFARHARGGEKAYLTYRVETGRAILLGLEFLVAADIIRTVVVAPTFDNVVVLGMIVLVRTFLSMSLELELEGRWPWQKRNDSAGR